MEQTAVEWLEQRIRVLLTYEQDVLFDEVFDQAKVMEEQAKVEFAFRAYSEMLSTGKSFVDIVNSMRTFKSE